VKKNRKSQFRASGDALLAEEAVARLLSQHRCHFDREVPLPTGRTADFRVVRGAARFHVHVKWLSAPAAMPRPGPIPRVLRTLEMVRRPIEVAIRWRPGAGCAAFKRVVREVTPFLLAARVSEERRVRDAQGREIASLRFIGPAARGASLTLIDARIVEHRSRQAQRALRLLRKAAIQFMPRSTNVILIVSADPLDRDAIDVALHGSVVERWDRFPARGERVAHGRADDGFWSLGRSSASRAVAWLRAGDVLPHTAPRASRSDGNEITAPPASALWLRDEAKMPTAVIELLQELFAG